MKIEPTMMSEVKLLRPERFADARGWFSETYRMDVLQRAGIHDTFVQENQSFSVTQGTVRGLHFQVAPHPQAKLVRVLAGRILDVAVDLRSSSPTFGRHIAIELDAEGGEQLYVPVGFGHGFCTLAPNTMVAYKVSGYYSHAHDRNLAWNDPQLAIEWPVSGNAAVLSDKDRRAPTLGQLGQVFE